MRLVLRPSIQTILENVLLKKNINSAVTKDSGLYISVRLIVLFKASIALVVFCLVVLPIIENVILKYQIIVYFYTHIYQFLLHVFRTVLGARTFLIIIAPWCIDLFITKCLFLEICLKVRFVWHHYCHCKSLTFAICMVYHC